MTLPAIEIASFTLADGVSEAELLAASDQLETTFLAPSEGYLGRYLVRKDARTWSDIVFWRSPDDVARAMERVGGSAACAAYFRCMNTDDSGQGLTVYAGVKGYGALPVR